MRCWLLAAALLGAGCLSDLSVGVSASEVDEADSGASHDAGRRDAAAEPLPDAEAARDAQVEPDADEPPYFELCEHSACLLGFVSPERSMFCADASQAEVCARLDPDEACQWVCPDPQLGAAGGELDGGEFVHTGPTLEGDGEDGGSPAP